MDKYLTAMVENHVLNMEINHSRVLYKLTKFNGMTKVGEKVDLGGLGVVCWERAKAPSSAVVCIFYPSTLSGVRKMLEPISLAGPRYDSAGGVPRTYRNCQRKNGLAYLVRN